jgi:8-amino-3,8-dideoxy-alpha-D-manno-octulosonate transaminase
MGTFSFDPVKTITTGEGGMVTTNDPELGRTLSEYHDHGHDHVVNPGGRGGEGRRFVGFNFRMMELQGALGLAQLAKLDGIVAAQKANKGRMREAISVIPGVTFRTQVDAAGDSATFLAFFLPSAEKAQAVNGVLREHGAGAVYFAENTWHYYPRWEHLLQGSTLARSGWPFNEADGRRRVIYDPQALPKSAEIMGRTLVFQVPVKLSDERLAQIAAAAKAAAAL